MCAGYDAVMYTYTLNWTGYIFAAFFNFTPDYCQVLGVGWVWFQWFTRYTWVLSQSQLCSVVWCNSTKRQINCNESCSLKELTIETVIRIVQANFSWDMGVRRTVTGRILMFLTGFGTWHLYVLLLPSILFCVIQHALNEMHKPFIKVTS